MQLNYFLPNIQAFILFLDHHDIYYYIVNNIFVTFVFYKLFSLLVKQSLSLMAELVNIFLSVHRLDQDFAKALKTYVEHGYQKDSVALNIGGSEMSEFTQLLETAAAGVRR